MREHSIERLLALSGELAAFESAVAEASISEVRQQPALIVRHWVLAITGAAAAIAFMAGYPAPRASTLDKKTQPAPLLVHASPVAVRGDMRSACFRPVAQEPLSMVAIFRAWSADCNCLDWRLHRFEDDATQTMLNAGDSVDIELAMTDAPPVEQALILLVASHSDALPSDVESARPLIGCISDQTPVDARSTESFSYASAVSSCVPPEVTLVSHPFRMTRH